jgi:hypothetical protein
MTLHATLQKNAAAFASQKGPHFADPLEMWGEALMARSRSAVRKNGNNPDQGQCHLNRSIPS